MPVESVYVLLAIVLAIIGDIWLMRGWRQSRLKTDASSGQQVCLLDSNSPVLTGNSCPLCRIDVYVIVEI